MIEFNQIKIKISEFFNKYKLQIFVVSLAVIFIFALNYFLSISKKEEIITTKDPFAFIMEPSAKVPTKLYIESENLIANFATKASNGEYEAAYEMLSNDCKNDVFGSLSEFIKYVKTNFPKNSRFEINPYSKVNSTYVYQVKVFEDFLSTGLTYSDYSYIDLKMAINENNEGEKLLSVAGYMGNFPINSVFENDYIKVEVTGKKSFYTEEIYYLTITNRTENDIILRDFSNAVSEIQLNVAGDSRDENSVIEKLLLLSYESKSVSLTFPKFFDETSKANAIGFSSIRVVKKDKTENYTEDDMIAKFSINVDVSD